MYKKTIFFSLFLASFCSILPATAQNQTQNTQIETKGEPAPISFNVKNYEESQIGTPGYKAKLNYLDISSDKYPHAQEISKYINAKVLDGLFEARKDGATSNLGKFCDETDRDDEGCANEIDMQLVSKALQGQVVSVRYNSFYFPVGAAHPMHDVESFNFVINPVFKIDKVEDIFSEPDAVFEKVQQKVRGILTDKLKKDGDASLVKDEINDGTHEWDDFEIFTFGKDGITFIFPPYQVAAYAAGTQQVTIPYADIKEDMESFYLKALDIK